ncbi:MAG: alpha/beta fold hydrolase, partial [Pseudomonadota bacterium]
PHPTLGDEVGAAVVLRDGSSVTAKALTRYLRERIVTYKVPRYLEFVADIPKGPTGKYQRRDLADVLGVSGEPASVSGPNAAQPASDLERTLCGIWASTLGLPSVGPNDDFVSLGGDSLQAIELFLQVEKTLGRTLPRSLLFEARTVAEMAERIASAESAGCVVQIRAEGERPIFFCVHDVLGEVFNLGPLADSVGDDQPFYGLRLAGLDGAETPLARVEHMAARYIDEIRKLQPAGPYYLGGYSMGGMIAYEMARQLRAAGDTVGMLALLDTYLPQARWRKFGSRWRRALEDPRLDDARRLDLRGVKLRLQVVGEVAATRARRIAFRTAWRFCERTMRVMPKRLQRPAAASYLALRTYDVPRFGGDAVYFRATPYPWDGPEARSAWEERIAGNMKVVPVAGCHHEIMVEPHVRELGRKLDAELRAAQEALDGSSVRPGAGPSRGVGMCEAAPEHQDGHAAD